MQLDEQALRKPTFLGGVPVTLADGQDWMVPVPELRLRYDRSSPEGMQYSFSFNGQIDPEYTRLRSEYDENPEKGLFYEFKMMDRALAVNYQLDDEQIGTLLDFRVGKDVEDEVRTRFLDVLNGVDVAKKASSGGCDLL